jgi:hypothetical protein
MGNGSITLPKLYRIYYLASAFAEGFILHCVIIGPQLSPPYVVQFIVIESNNDNANKKSKLNHNFNIIFYIILITSSHDFINIKKKYKQN